MLNGSITKYFGSPPLALDSATCCAAISKISNTLPPTLLASMCLILPVMKSYASVNVGILFSLNQVLQVTSTPINFLANFMMCSSGVCSNPQTILSCPCKRAKSRIQLSTNSVLPCPGIPVTVRIPEPLNLNTSANALCDVSNPTLSPSLITPMTRSNKDA